MTIMKIRNLTTKLKTLTPTRLTLCWCWCINLAFINIPIRLKTDQDAYCSCCGHTWRHDVRSCSLGDDHKAYERERDREKRKNITDEDINHPNTKTSKRQAELETGVIKIVFIIPQASYRHLLNKKKVSFYFTFFVFSTFVGVFNYQF